MIFLIVALIALVFLLGLVVMAWESVEARDARNRNHVRRGKCRSTLGNLKCEKWPHEGPHRNGLVVWADRIPAWIERKERGLLPAKELVS